MSSASGARQIPYRDAMRELRNVVLGIWKWSEMTEIDSYQQTG